MNSSDSPLRLAAMLAPHPPKPPKASSSRSGRNMPAAISTAAILLALVALSLAFNPAWFTLLALLAFSIGLWEAAGAFLVKEIHVPLVPMWLGLVLVLCATHFAGITAGFVAFSLAAFLVVMWRFAGHHEQAVIDGVVGVFALAWIGLSGMFAVAMTSLPHAAWVCAALILMPAASDTGGLVLGMFFGKHPINASISPKKSWEGFVGSVIFSAWAAWLLIYLALGLSWVWVLIFTLVTPVLATMGDFSESLLKRDLGIKDMGSIFPGHGGVLDRIDAMLFCAPAFYLLYCVAFGVL